MSFGEKLQRFHELRKSEKANSRKDYYDHMTREWKPGYCAGEMAYPLTTLREILPKEPTPDGGYIGPSGFNLDADLDWTGQPKNSYFDLLPRIIENYKYNLEPENVTLCNGVGGGDFIVPMAILKPGDEVIVPRPSWVSFEPVSYAIGAKTKILPLKEELGWKWDIDELNETVTHDTRLIYICNPNNPTGRIYDEKEIKAICEIAKDNNAYVLSDEEFRGTEMDGPFMSTPAACNSYYNAASISGISKLFCAAGIRVGWVASQNKELLAKANRVRGLTGGLGGFQVALAWSMNESKTIQRIYEKNKKFQIKSRAIVNKFMDGQDFFSLVPPQAGFITFPGWTYDIDEISFVDGLFESKNVRVWPSNRYKVEKHIRLGIGRISAEMLTENLRLIGEYTKQFK